MYHIYTRKIPKNSLFNAVYCGNTLKLGPSPWIWNLPQTFIYSSSPCPISPSPIPLGSPLSPLYTRDTTQVSHPHQHILSATLPQPAVDTRNANEVTVEMSERPIFVVSKLDCSSPGGARRWRIYRRYAARLWFTRRSEGGPDYRHRTLTGMCGPRTL